MNKKEIYNVKPGEKDVDDIKPIIEFCTMSREHKDFIILKVKDAMKQNLENNISYFQTLARKIKVDLEADKNETWNCVVGTDFGAYLAFEKANLIYFRMNELYFLIFRFGA